mgnify:CR=1 FL=1
MSKVKKKLSYKFIIFCEGDTEKNYFNSIELPDGCDIRIESINMNGGGYTNFINKIRKHPNANCLAKFIIIDLDKAKQCIEEKCNLYKLISYCSIRNKRGDPHFIILNNPDFEYVACLHMKDYEIGRDTKSFIEEKMNYRDLSRYKNDPDVYEVLNKDPDARKRLLSRAKGRPCYLSHDYTINRRNKQINIKKYDITRENRTGNNTNIYEFFEVVEGV